MKKLKSCPFCGGEVQIALSGDADYGYFWMVTRAYSKNACKCRIFMESDLMETYEGEKFKPKSDEAQAKYNELVEAWNTRVDLLDEKDCYLSIYKHKHYISAEAMKMFGKRYDVLANDKTHEIAIVPNDSGKYKLTGKEFGATIIKRQIKAWGYEVQSKYKLKWHNDTKCFTLRADEYLPVQDKDAVQDLECFKERYKDEHDARLEAKQKHD